MTDPLDRLKAALADRYLIERELGQGGMATVYLAEDLKHKRQVALKVLKPELAAVLGAERFVQEITTTASLQHPHILPLFDSGEADSFLYYVMPYIEGETLRAKLDRETQLGIDQAVRIASEVADALDYAHRQGVIHRDIKPENILLHDGRPMVADFGIALAVSAAAGGRMTETGLSLGTPHYMSPEQATADRDITNRSDIYSLGAVLYEMLTGDPPHTGSSAQQIIAQIVTEEPQPVTKARKSVPPNVAAALAVALEKLPADRFESAKAFAGALLNPGYTRQRTAGFRWAPTGDWRQRIAIPMTLLAIVLGVLAIIGLGRDRTGAPVTPRYWNLVLPDSAPLIFVGEAGFGVGLTAMALSPAGAHLVYVGPAGGATRLYLRSLDDFGSRPLAGTEGAHAPFFSPNGDAVGFFVEDQLLQVSLTDGQVVPIATLGDPNTGSWSEDDRIAVASVDRTSLSIVSPASGRVDSVPHAPDPRSPRSYASPHWLPGGEWILHQCDGRPLPRMCVSNVTGESRWLRVDATAHPTDTTGALLGTNPRYVEPGFLVYSAPTDNIVLGVRFDPSDLRVHGQPVPLFQGVRREGFGALQMATSRSGLMVYAPGENAQTGTLVWADRTGTLDTLPFPPQVYGDFSLSSDGRFLAILVFSATREAQLQFLELATGRSRPWVGGGAVRAQWEPGSRWLVGVSGGALVRFEAAAGSGADTLALLPPGTTVEDVGRDGRLLLRYSPDASPGWDWSRLALLDRQQLSELAGPQLQFQDLVDAPGSQVLASLSPDMQWVGFTSTETGRYEIFVSPLPVTGPPIKISTDGGEEPLWSPRGDGLYYRDGRRWYWVARTGSEDAPFADPVQWIQGDFLNVSGMEYAVSPDGQRLLLLQGDGHVSSVGLNVITNWGAELERRIPR
ncbi:MAG: protein kinase [Gemmatimonadales bacterium]|nr:protein kinase [Gemmatimonadales bacterium]